VTARRDLGDFGERLAGHRLEAAGMTIVARNVRTRGGEIDLLARDGEDLVFVEVRTRRSAPGAAAESVSAPKLQRMWQCAMDYCETNGLDPDRVRIDLVSIDLRADGVVGAVEHFPALEVPEG
jgi:putative endonuclease